MHVEAMVTTIAQADKEALGVSELCYKLWESPVYARRTWSLRAKCFPIVKSSKYDKNLLASCSGQTERYVEEGVRRLITASPADTA